MKPSQPVQMRVVTESMICDGMLTPVFLQDLIDLISCPLFILQCDQRKGFDMLEPQGFCDAVSAYGLSIDLES